MLKQPIRHILLSISFLCIVQMLMAKTGRYRLMWRADPATTMTIAWDQINGTGATVYIDVADKGQHPASYKWAKPADHVVQAKGMNNHFARLTGLRPNTVYYFIISDGDSCSEVMSFQTTSNSSRDRLSIIAGGDSRNHREARREANVLVGKLRPHVVFFGGDMTGGDTAPEWKNWMDDWQLTKAGDGRMTPIVVARGNHEASNKTLIDLFDVPAKHVYYSMTFGGNLLRAFTLNSMVAPNGQQQVWLQKELARSGDMRWKMAQYHVSIRPHTRKKAEKNDQLLAWSTLFYKYGVNLVVESDAHVVKSTWPIRPSKEAGSHLGFIRDDAKGTVYVGEGCWGAPLRPADDPKPWTRATGSFNQFKWIFVDRNKIEVRTIETNGSSSVGELTDANRFRPPFGLVIWSPPTGDVITIQHPSDIQYAPPIPSNDALAIIEEKGELTKITHFKASRVGGDIFVRFSTEAEARGMRFNVQRSTDGTHYITIAVLPSKGGNSTYEFIDKGYASRNPGTYVNYRIERVFPDGKTAVFKPGN